VRYFHGSWKRNHLTILSREVFQKKKGFSSTIKKNSTISDNVKFKTTYRVVWLTGLQNRTRELFKIVETMENRKITIIEQMFISTLPFECFEIYSTNQLLNNTISTIYFWVILFQKMFNWWIILIVYYTFSNTSLYLPSGCLSLIITDSSNLIM